MIASDTTQDDEYTASVVMPRAMAEQANRALWLLTVPMQAFSVDLQDKAAYRSHAAARLEVAIALAAAGAQSEDVEIATTYSTRRAIRAACQAAILFKVDAPSMTSGYRLDTDLLNDVCTVMEEVASAITDVTGVSNEH